MSEDNKVQPPLRTGDPRLSKKAEPVEMNDEAFSIARGKDGRLYLVTLKYDFESGKGEVTESLEQGNRAEAFERFKIKVSQSKVMG